MKTKCISCEREIDENDFIAYNMKDEPVCESCESDAWNYASTVAVMHGSGEEKVYKWCSDFGFRDAEYWEEANPPGVTGFKYIKTDGWRGYWEPVLAEGYTTLASGWSTDRWSDVAYKHGFNDLVEGIQDGNLLCPFDVIFAFGLTSNVFSVASDVIVREADLDGFSQWLSEEAGMTTEELERTLR